MSEVQALDVGKDLNVVKLAREIACDHYPLETVLKNNGISPRTWAILSIHPRFVELVRGEQMAWNAAVNTTARVRLKSASVVEEWLLYANTALHNNKETLNAKIELIKLLGKFGGLDQPDKVAEADAAARVQINIKIGETAVSFSNQGGDPDVNSQFIEGELADEAPEFDWDEEFPPMPIPQSEVFFEEAPAE